MPLPPFASGSPTIATIPGLPKSLSLDGWTVITSNPANNGASFNTSSVYSRTGRVRHIVPQGLVFDEIAVFYVNSSALGYGGAPNYTPLKVKAALFPLPSAAAPNMPNATPGIGYFSFKQSHIGVMGRGKGIMSDPLLWGGASGTVFFIHTYFDATLPAAPAAPSATGNTGSGSSFTAAQTYGLSVTYVFPGGIESYTSLPTTVTINSTGNNIVVTSPSDPLNGSTGYRIWISNQGSPSGTAYETLQGVIPYGTNITLTAGPSLTSTIEQTVPTGLGYGVGGCSLAGGTGPGAANTGEGVANNADYTNGITGIGTGSGGSSTPGAVYVLARCRGGVGRSCSPIGDSICTGTGDASFMNGGSPSGFMIRALTNQVLSAKLDTTKVPIMGCGNFGLGGESAATFAGNNGVARSQWANMCTSVWSNYGTNDLASGVAALALNTQTIAARFTGANRNFFATELFPRGGTTDAYLTVANQTLSVGAAGEACRRAFNNWGADATGAATVTGESLFQGFAGSVGPTYNVYGGGNGTATQFWFAYPCLAGSEVITNGGVTCTFNASPSGQNQYSRLLPVTINGQTYISGIQSGSAPTNGNAMISGYTKLAGFVSLCGSLCTWIMGPSSIEINSAGTPGVNGGFTKLSGAYQVGPRALTSVSASTLTDSTQSWTQDQWLAGLGYSVVIVTDSVTPTAVGQIRAIQSNTATVLSFPNWTVTPSTSATYGILQSFMTEGTHPTTAGHISAAAAVNTNLFV